MTFFCIHFAHLRPQILRFSAKVVKLIATPAVDHAADCFAEWKHNNGIKCY